MDQRLVSQWLMKYISKYGWDKISLDYYRHPVVQGRIDREDASHGEWDTLLDRGINANLFKDAHFCRQTFVQECWWRVFHLMEPRLDRNQKKQILTYRSKFLDLMLNSNKNVGGGKEIQQVQVDEIVRTKVLEEGGVDTRLVWTHVYPKTFIRDYVPKAVDWSTERLFREIRSDGKYFTIVPRNDGTGLKGVTGLEHVNASEILFRK